MTVSELIAQLKELDGSLQVRLSVNAEYVTELENVYQEGSKVLLED